MFAFRWVRLLSVLAVLALAASVVATMWQPPVERQLVAEAPDSGSAIQAARAQGTSVVVDDLHTPTRVVRANPDGTLTAELSAVPVRVRKGRSWVPVDTSVSRRRDGSLAPNAAVGDLSLSGGGTTPLVRMAKDGKAFELFWPQALPEPVIAGSLVTYPEVYPGVDLEIFAERTGYRQHLIVKTPAAARNPALAQIHMRARTDGLTLRVGDVGELSAVDSGGEVVFTAPPAAMWDSSGAAPNSPATARSARVGMAIQDDVLVLRPDAGFLADPSVVFPVVIDPAMNTWDKTNWATTLSGKTGSYWWTSGAGNTVAQVGNCYTPRGDCNGIGEAWSYFQFDTGFTAGKHILSAELQTTVVHSPNCEARGHQFYLANSQITPSTTWANRPQGTHLDTRSIPGVYGDCGQHKPVGFGPGTYGIGGVATYYLRATDGADQIAWRKYDPAQTKLAVHYNTVPDAPTELRMDPPLPAPCRWCEGMPWIGDSKVRLLAKLTDGDGDSVSPKWRTSVNGAFNYEWGGAAQVSGARHDTTVDLDGVDGKTVGWWMSSTDGRDESSLSTGYTFVVDRVAPHSAPTVDGVLYRQDNRWHGGVGVPGSFTFGANGVADVDHYLYGWSDPPVTPVDADNLGGSATVSLAPSGDGPRDLYVRSVGRAGHPSATTVFHFYVRPGNGADAQWSFDNNTSDTAFLGDRHGTANGAVTYTSGAVGSAARFPGDVGSTVVAPNTVRTDLSFSASAWVRLDSLPAESGAATIVAQEGTHVNGFQLGYYNAPGGGWALLLPSADSAQRPADTVVMAPGPAQVGVWTHVTAVYDAGDRTARLYVNGAIGGTAVRADGFHATGLLVVGRGQRTGGPSDPLAGSVDELQVYDRALSETEIRAAVVRDNIQIGHWRFNEAVDLPQNPGTTARNAVDGAAMVLTNGAVFTVEGDRGVVGLDGVDDVVTAGTPVVRSDQTFSVAAWVRPDRLPTSGEMVAVSQDGQRRSGFGLYYDSAAQRWAFGRASADDDAANRVVALATQPVRTDEWVHLTGVFDATTRELRIFVGGVLSGSATLPGAPWNATGPMVVGRGLSAGAPADHWAGSIDEVRVYSRVLAEDEIVGILSRDDVVLARWRMDGTTDGGAVGGGPGWAAGQSDDSNPSDLALLLDGVDDHVSAPVAVSTTASYSVSAWVRPDKAGAGTVISRDGDNTSAFALGVGADGKWQFTSATADQANSTVDRAIGGSAQVGVWTHVVGVHSRERARLELYVNGVLAGSAAHTSGFDAGGAVQLGRARSGGAYSAHFAGAVDDVAIHARPLYAQEVRTMAGRDLSLVHKWQFDEQLGATASDSVGARAATLTGGAGFGPGRVGNAARFDGVNDSAATQAVDVRTDQSFTVSAWVYLDTVCVPVRPATTCKVDAVSLDGAQTSKFRLGHRADRLKPRGQWFFEMAKADTGEPQTNPVTLSVEPGEQDAWVHLTGVYDAAAGQMWLYVNGERVADNSLDSPWHASGGLRVGSGKTAGVPANFWPGGVDDVRIYYGALDDIRLHSLVRSYPAPAVAPTVPLPDAGQWKFDETTGTVAADSATNRAATVRGGAQWRPGRVANGLRFDGVSGHAETAERVLDTAASFSMSAWALPEQGSGIHSVLSLGGAEAGALAVQYRGSDRRFVARVAGVAPVEVVSAESPQPGSWSHVSVSYDATARQFRLYVNGGLSAIQNGVVVPPSEGVLSIGKTRRGNADADLFAGTVDDVRLFTTAVGDGQVRRLHDDVALALHGHWRFDGNATDSSWRATPATVGGTTSYVPGMNDQAIRLDGKSGSVAVAGIGVPMVDSFTVSAWVNLARTDRVQTVLAQDGVRASGFVLQYRPELNRWVFGAPVQDADAQDLVYAQSGAPPKVNQWTHLTGVYDAPARQLRLYIDGQAAGDRGNVQLWPAWNGFTIGRAKVDGAPAAFFDGMIDEVTTDVGAAPPAEAARRGGHPAPPPGQLGSYVNSAGEHYTDRTDKPVRPGYRFESALGVLATSATGTHPLYSCTVGADTFTSTDPNCEGMLKNGEIGRVYTTAPAGLATIPVYRCNTGTDHFESRAASCGGATQEYPLGYTAAYAPLARYVDPVGTDHWTTIDEVPPGYVREAVLGWVSLTAQEGTKPIYSCRVGADEFTSMSEQCEGKRLIGPIGHIWEAPLAWAPGIGLYRCVGRFAIEDHFDSVDDGCEGYTTEWPAGHLLRTAPAQGTP